MTGAVIFLEVSVAPIKEDARRYGEQISISTVQSRLLYALYYFLRFTTQVILEAPVSRTYSSYQSFKDRATTNLICSPLPTLITRTTIMATNQITDMNNVMDLSLPSSTEPSRPGTPTETNCERLISVKNDIEKFSIVVENTKAGLKTLLFAGIPENDPTNLDHNRRLEEYQRLQQLAVSEFTSQPFCNTPGCTIHHTPSCTPVKTIQNSKTTATKRKDNEDGYLDLKNKFEQLRLEQTGPALTGTDPTHSKNTPDSTPKTNSDTTSNGNKKLLPPPVFLEISNEYRERIKVLYKKFPALRNGTTSQTTPVIKPQTQASRETTAPQLINSNQNSNAALITQTLQGIIQALTTLTVQISNMNFTNNTPQPTKPKKSKQIKKRELCALIEAIYDEDDE
ncbi:hypothetical protein TNCV_4504241 [Trichonephila clavipes]|nr:hypothetical protein TNCV_4504241 [Trichonephila clavipes]